MSNVSLSLLVLKTRQMEKLRIFYSDVGIKFDDEKHGTGPKHLAGKLNETVFEIYPLADGDQTDSTTRIGFFVEDVDLVLESLWRNKFCELKKAKETEWAIEQWFVIQMVVLLNCAKDTRDS